MADFEMFFEISKERDRLRRGMNRVRECVDRIRYAGDAEVEAYEVSRLLELFDPESGEPREGMG